MTRWKCRKCDYIYDPRIGDPDGGIPPGTPFERIPDDWRCPVCGAAKADFYPLGTAQPAAARPAPRSERPERMVPRAEPAARGVSPPEPPPGWTVGPLKRH